MLELMSCGMFDVVDKGSTKPTRCKAALSFKFDKASLPTTTLETVEAAITPVVATESQAALVNTKTISLGQSMDQVKEVLGQTERIVDLGPKVTYIYKDMKVIFQGGKVADVQ
jgi:hypothetical protein